MNTLDEQLAHRLHDIVDTEPDSVPPVADLLDRGRRARRRRTAALVGTTCAVLALGAATATAVVALPGPTGRPAVTARGAAPTSAAPPAMELVAAATASENISYRMRLTTAGPDGLTYEGAFDPRTATGYVRVPQDDVVMTQLLIDGTLYEGGERPQGPKPADKGPGETYGRYGQYPGRHDRLTLHADGNDVLGAAASDPAALFAALKRVDATVTENPDGTLRFEYTTVDGPGTVTTRGDVALDGDGRIAKVALAGTWRTTAKGRLDTGTFASTLELFDYGLPVRVERPTDVVVLDR
ncbi:hypothetical protein ACFOOK_20450 [Micromonospora krabiensis]|uniref:Uncharacterized protein n=1 Tax=Micromonospora krabiensis TaxID=307121 RepID=A0A1C3N900_9ACTN|nr:hypothetical protein [Micromonospora krabiensis]SBV29060.1 hypothetical protein GA0070620_4622 [Micromonospora krabiensis]